VAAVVVWCGLVGVGLREFFAYSTTRGDIAQTAERWPDDTKLVRGDDATVVMFVHPECPCSRASLAELATLGAPSVIVVFAGSDDGSAWDAAGRIAHTRRVVDDGSEAVRFGARTSGYTVVYDRDGFRRFAGGITGSRGHAGANVGSDMVRQILAGTRQTPSTHPVFGCPIGETP
jgi:hypothetical protein